MDAPHALIIEVRLPGGRFHGMQRTDAARPSGAGNQRAEWPPSPLRLFQALVAGAYGGRWAAEPDTAADAKASAFAWLESLEAPIVAAPHAHTLEPVMYFVPNNDLDSVDGDPRRAAEMRVAKRLHTVQFNADQSVLYAWGFDGAVESAERMVALALRLHTFGHGMDHAFATAAVVSADESLARLRLHPGAMARPGGAVTGAGNAVPCPAPGTLASLIERHRAAGQRFRRVSTGRKPVVEFRQPPHAYGRMVAYGSGPKRLIFELRDADRPSVFKPTPQSDAVELVKSIRDLGFERLAGAMPEQRVAIARAVVGRGTPPPMAAERVRFIALPSIGTPHTSPSIRRVLVEVPAQLPFACEDLRWALAGRSLGGRADADGVITGATLLASVNDDAMLRRYLGPSRTWRTVTPAVLPLPTGRRAESGDQRAADEQLAAVLVQQALRHAGVEARALHVRVQREPFHGRGLHARAYASDRFNPARLCHIDIAFDREIAGPLAIGDGRWLGLGLFAPVREPAHSLHVFEIDGAGPDIARASLVSRALRSAVMSRAQSVIGARHSLPLFFSGHADDGAPAAGEAHRHLYCLADDSARSGRLDRLAVMAPRRADNTARHLAQLAAALDGFVRLRVEGAGILTVRAVAAQDDDPVFGIASRWTSRTPYRPARHPKGAIADAIRADVHGECLRHGLPRPESVTVLDVITGPRGRIAANVRLHFATRVRGPILLGRMAHFGGSLFERETGVLVADS